MITHCYWEQVHAVTTGIFFYLYIGVIDCKFVTDIYHRGEDFNFEVISYPFPESNVHSMLGYKTFYS